ncbi:hypothetical protein DER45DRAFT_572231 [Fusarium avenaceum]|nr:hypothetical protein DER45DRAFT_572231 [Fusarium avenaceum]
MELLHPTYLATTPSLCVAAICFLPPSLLNAHCPQFFAHFVFRPPVLCYSPRPLLFPSCIVVLPFPIQHLLL